MATTSSTLLHSSSRLRVHAAHHQSRTAELPQTVLFSSRRAAVLLTASTFLATASELKAKAQDIPLFGLRKKLKKAEEEAELVVREGFEAAEKGIEAAEKGIEAAEKGMEAAKQEIAVAEGEIEAAVSFGGLAQAGAVAGAEFVGVVVASSVVNGILGSGGQKS